MLWRCAQWTAALGLLVWLWCSHGETVQQIRQTPIHMGLFVAAMACAFCSQLIMGLRWYCLIPPGARGVRAVETCRATYLAALSNYSPLGDYGGLTYRVAFLKSAGRMSVSEAVMSVALDRIFGLAALIMIYGFAATLLWSGTRLESMSVLLALVYGVLAVTFVLVTITIGSRCPGLFRQRRADHVRWFLMSCRTWFPQQRRQVVLAFGCGLASQSFAVLALTCIGGAVSHGSTSPTLLQNAVVSPMVELSAILIPTPSGIGVREFALTRLYGTVLQGVSLEDASRLGFLVALVLRLAVFLSTLLGCILSTALSRHCLRTAGTVRAAVTVPSPALPYPSSTGRGP